MGLRDTGDLDLLGAGNPVPLAQDAPVSIPGVTELTRRIRWLLEDEVGEVWVQGEISNLRRHSSGHSYFTLKDDSAQLACVLFRANAKNAPALSDGMAVQAFGRITIYEARGQYQLVAEIVQQTGAGTLQARFEALKRKLEAEGLFDPAHKRPLPPLPHAIGVVTSPSGAAVRDLLNIFARRAPFIRIYIAPVPVQGSQAAPAIVNALAGFGGAADNGWPQVDLVILARGGGSIEDLWAFNEETLARAIAGCPLPVVSAVGHEIDFTIADFVADLRAPTPSAAAELTAPDGEAMKRGMRRMRETLTRRVRERVSTLALKLARFGEGTLRREAWRRLADNSQSLDRMAGALQERTGVRVASVRARADYLAKRLGACSPFRRVAESGKTLQALSERFAAAGPRLLAQRTTEVSSLGGRLRLLGPQGTLDRGYSVTLANGRVLRNALDVQEGAAIETRLAGGRLISVVNSTGTK